MFSDYAPEYRAHPAFPAISATLPTRAEVYRADHLFPFFQGLLSEDVKKERQCFELHIDEDDAFSRLLDTSAYGAVGGGEAYGSSKERKGRGGFVKTLPFRCGRFDGWT